MIAECAIPGVFEFMFSGWQSPEEIDPPLDEPVVGYCYEWGFPETIWFLDCSKLYGKNGESYLVWHLSPEFYPVPKYLYHPPGEVISWERIAKQQMELPL